MRYYLDEGGVYLHTTDLEASLEKIAESIDEKRGCAPSDYTKALRVVARAVNQMRLAALEEEATRQLRDRSSHNAVRQAVDMLNKIARRT